MTKLQTKNGEYLALSPKELEPLIKSDVKRLHQAERQGKREVEQVQREAQEKLSSLLQPIRIAIGEKLNVAKPHFTSMEFSDWIKTKFNLSRSAADQWMRMAAHELADSFKNVQDFRRQTSAGYTSGNSRWTEPVRKAVGSINFDRWAEDQKEREKEQKLERQIARELIKIGYKVLASKMHPDRSTGSHDAMRRLNAVRAQLMKVYE